MIGFIWIDLPSLQSIEFGGGACAGRVDPCSSLIMRSLNKGIWIEMIDLPNLTSLTSENRSFCNVCVVTLESMNIYWRLLLLDIPNLRNVNLPDAFTKVRTKSISSWVSIIWLKYRCLYYFGYSCLNRLYDIW